MKSRVGGTCTPRFPNLRATGSATSSLTRRTLERFFSLRRTSCFDFCVHSRKSKASLRYLATHTSSDCCCTGHRDWENKSDQSAGSSHPFNHQHSALTNQDQPGADGLRVDQAYSVPGVGDSKIKLDFSKTVFVMEDVDAASAVVQKRVSGNRSRCRSYRLVEQAKIPGATAADVADDGTLSLTRQGSAVVDKAQSCRKPFPRKVLMGRVGCPRTMSPRLR